MQDLEIAESQLNEKGLKLCVVKEANVVFESETGGIVGFLTMIEKLGRSLEGASIADRVVGRAIALLCVYAKVKAVYASVLSKEGKDAFEEHAIPHRWNRLVENVLDVERIRICPFEKLAMELSDPAKAYRKLRNLQHGPTEHLAQKRLK